jgi:hypothetical protein
MPLGSFGKETECNCFSLSNRERCLREATSPSTEWQMRAASWRM